jgi:transcriptional regulator with XRE-family HTH domain
MGQNGTRGRRETVEREVEVVSEGALIAQRVKEIREKRGWTQQDLADAVADVGGPLTLSRTALAKLEAGGTRARNVSVEELLVLAVALGAYPVDLMVPVDDELADRPPRRLKVTPGNPARPAEILQPEHARAWVCGVGGPPADRDLLFALSLRPPSVTESHDRVARLGAQLIERGVDPAEADLIAEQVGHGTDTPPPPPAKAEVTRKPKQRGRVRVRKEDDQ